MTLPLAGCHIGLLTSQASRLGGGVFEAVILQAQMIRTLGGKVTVFALEDQFSAEDAGRLAPAQVVHASVVGPAQIGFAPALLRQLLSAELDCLHLHGIWMYPSRVGLQWARKTGRRYMISVHGMLNPWITARGRWKKALARWGYERASWARADLVHALTANEASDIAKATGRDDIRIIPNAAPALRSPPSGLPAPHLVSIGRIHPVKNLDNLLAGWLQADLPEGARLTFAGWGDEGDVAAFKDKVAAAGNTVEFVGPAFGKNKDDLLASARFAALPSLVEAFPMAALDAWARGLPVVMSREASLPEGFKAGAAIESGLDPGSIARALEAAFSLDEPAWLAMSKEAQVLAGERFGTDSIAQQWARAYLGQTGKRQG